MNRIFIGMLLVFLNFNLDIGASRIGLIPDFIGYIFMIMGLTELLSLSERSVKASPYAKAMAVYTGILYIMDILGVSVILGDSKALLDNIRKQYENLETWSAVFSDSAMGVKKMITSQIISAIRVSRGYHIDIGFNISFEQFVVEM